MYPFDFNEYISGEKIIIMKQKKICLLLLIVIILLVGCGESKADSSEEMSSGLSTWIKKCESESRLAEYIDMQIVSEINSKIVYSAWEDSVDSADEEKKRSYTITCMDRVYCNLKQELTPEDWEAFQIYWPVLQGEVDFYYTVKMSFDDMERVSEDGRDSIAYPHTEKITMHDYYEERQEWWYAYKWIERVSLTDLDGDGEKEFIMSDVYDGETLVLHRENNKIYGIDFVRRAFQSLQEDGIFGGSGGASHTVYSRLVFRNGMFVEEELAERETPKYYIGGKEVSEAEFEEWESIHMNNDAQWYEMDSWDIWDPSAYDQLEIFAKNYKKWMIGKGNNYSYCVYDFGQDEYLELVVTVYEQDGVKNYFYQVDEEDIRELEQDYNGLAGKEFDICNETTVAFYDKSAGMVYYESGKMGSSGYFYIENGIVHYILENDIKEEESTGIEDGKIKGSVSLEPVQWSNTDNYAGYDIVLSNLVASYLGGEHRTDKDTPIPSNDEIKRYLNMTEEELENMTGAKIEKLQSLLVFETTLPFPVLFPENTSYWFVCTSWDTTCKPKYLSYNGDYEKEYLKRLGMENAIDFNDIMEIMGSAEIEASKTREEMEEIHITDYKNYKIEYEQDGLQYVFIADNSEGKNFTLYIGLAL